ncbi:hypothetical protein [Tropicimonas sp. IMCC34043]|nr:hypothetical protein [Tropicimonas sp. IMCC34043]
MASPEGREVRFYYRLAARLGRSVREVMDFPLIELDGWAAFLESEAS